MTAKHILLIGSIDRRNLADLVGKAERYVGRRIRTLVMSPEEYGRLAPSLSRRPRLLLWRAGSAEPVRT